MYTNKLYHLVIGENTDIEIVVRAKSYDEAIAKLERDSIRSGFPLPTIYRWYTTD